MMALTGAVLVLFVTFHCLMNAVAIAWPAAYNSVCEFLGANWYALIGSAVIAFLIILHVVYAVMLTLQNRKARGNVRYDIAKRPASVEWSSQNMLVLGIVVIAFLVVHLIQFWAKMQWVEIIGAETEFPPAAGTLFLQLAFSQPWTLVVYCIGFIALWFHFNHGFWSMFQSTGWNNTNWMPRLKKISAWWTSIVVALFIAEAVVFTVNANKKTYLTEPALREQYKEMIMPMIEKSFGPEAAQQVNMWSYEVASQQFHQMNDGMQQTVDRMNTPEGKEQLANNPMMRQQYDEMLKQQKCVKDVVRLFDYLESADNKPLDMNQFPGAQAAPNQTR